MRKHLILGFFAVAGSVAVAHAQNGSSASLMAPHAQASLVPSPANASQDPRALTKNAQLNLQGTLGLTNEQSAKLYDPFLQFYMGREKAMGQVNASADTNAQQMKSTHDMLSAILDKKLSTILTAAQNQKWLTVVKPSMQKGGQ